MLRDWRQWSGAKGHGCPCACQAWQMWYLQALSVARKGRETRNRATTSHEPGRVNRVNRLHLRIAHKLQRKTCAGGKPFFERCRSIIIESSPQIGVVADTDVAAWQTSHDEIGRLGVHASTFCAVLPRQPTL